MFGLFKKKPPANEQAVLIYIKLSDEAFGEEAEREGIFAIENRIMEALGNSADFDGNEFGGGLCTLYIYCPDASTTSQKLLPLLNSLNLPTGSYMVARSGEPGAPETRTALG